MAIALNCLTALSLSAQTEISQLNASLQKTDQKKSNPKASKLEKAMDILKHEAGTWDCTWEYFDGAGKVVNTVTGTEVMKLCLEGTMIELETFVPAKTLVSKSLRFYNPATEKLTLISVGKDGIPWEMRQDVDSNVMTSLPRRNQLGKKEVIRFTTIENAEDKMKVKMEISIDEAPWVSVFVQTLVRQKKPETRCEKVTGY